MLPRFDHRRFATALLAFATVAGAITPGFALDLDRKPVLRSNVSVKGDLVTIGDFFEGAGTVAGTAIFRAPDLGHSGTVPAKDVVAAAKAAGLFDASIGTVANIVVTHEARQITQEDMKRLIGDAALKQADLPSGSTLDIAFDQPFETRNTDANSGDPLRLAGLTFSAVTGRFEAVVVFDVGSGVERQRIRGTATEMVPMLTLTRTIDRNEVVNADDIIIVKQPRRVAGNARPVDASQIIGMAAKRQLRPDQPVSSTDFAPPVLVARGDTVTLVYQMPGLALTARGTAMDNGIKGEAVNILNPTSKRIVRGTVVSQGKVQVISGATTFGEDVALNTSSNNAPANGRTQQ
jgi:flagella basal body P-ring formation protein FlgA